MSLLEAEDLFLHLAEVALLPALFLLLVFLLVVLLQQEGTLDYILLHVLGDLGEEVAVDSETDQLLVTETVAILAETVF